MYVLLLILQMLTPWASLMYPPSPQPGSYEFLAMWCALSETPVDAWKQLLQ